MWIIIHASTDLWWVDVADFKLQIILKDNVSASSPRLDQREEFAQMRLQFVVIVMFVLQVWTCITTILVTRKYILQEILDLVTYDFDEYYTYVSTWH